MWNYFLTNPQFLGFHLAMSVCGLCSWIQNVCSCFAYPIPEHSYCVYYEYPQLRVSSLEIEENKKYAMRVLTTLSGGCICRLGLRSAVPSLSFRSTSIQSHCKPCHYGLLINVFHRNPMTLHKSVLITFMKPNPVNRVYAVATKSPQKD